jgi:hypothetical protein
VQSELKESVQNFCMSWNCAQYQHCNNGANQESYREQGLAQNGS